MILKPKKVFLKNQRFKSIIRFRFGSPIINTTPIKKLPEVFIICGGNIRGKGLLWVSKYNLNTFWVCAVSKSLGGSFEEDSGGADGIEIDWL